MSSSLPPHHWRRSTGVSALVLLTLSSVCLTEQKIVNVHENDDGQKLVLREVQYCGSHVTCETCRTSADPHCGWCSASKRCTTEDACQAGILGWSQTQIEHCPAIISTQPNLTHTGTPIKVKLTLTAAPPHPNMTTCVVRLPGGRIDEGVLLIADNTLECKSTTTWPQLPKDTVSQKLTVDLVVGGQVWLSTHVTVYDCTQHRNCDECVTSTNPCAWCISSSRCRDVHSVNLAEKSELDNFIYVVNSSKEWLGQSSGVGRAVCPRIEQSVLEEPLLDSRIHRIKNMASVQLSLIEIQNHPKLPRLLLSFFFVIVAIWKAIFIAFLLAMAATAIFLVFACLWSLRKKKRKESPGKNVQSRAPRNGIEVGPSSVQMDEVISQLQSLLKIIMDTTLKETVKASFIEPSYLKLEKIIGKGQFGRVYAGTMHSPENEEEPVKVAVKTLRGRKMANKKLESFMQEGVMMKNFDHPHVLHLIGVSIHNQSTPLIILPYMSVGDLHNYISNKEKHFEEPELLQLGRQVAEGMAYLEQKGFVHRDLAARNCMVDENLQVRVADFGLSRDIYKKQYYSTQDRQCKLPVRWMALESLEESRFTTKSDVWSFGVLLWELMTRGVLPYADVDPYDMKDYLTSSRRLKQPNACPNNVFGLMYECWRTNPDERPIFADLVNRLELIINPPQRNGPDESLYANSHHLSSHEEIIGDDGVMLRSLLKEVTDPKVRETLQNVFIPCSHLTMGDVLGKGQFGCVYSGLLHKQEKGTLSVAIKTLHGQTLDHEDVESFIKEGVMMKNLDHPHVLGLLGVSMSDQDKSPLVILPFMALGDLHNYVKNQKKRFTWRHLSQLGQQVAEGMAYLEECKLVHRDLAARNCMMDENLQVKVADFGLSRDIYNKEYITQNRARKMPIKWMALESLEDGIYTTKSDVWSFGVLLWELMTRGVMPYPDVDAFDMREYLTSGQRLEKPDICPEDVYILMSECWQKTPKDRPTFADLVNRLELMVIHKSSNINYRLSDIRNRMSLHARKCSPSPTGKVSDLPFRTSGRKLLRTPNNRGRDIAETPL